MKLIDDGRGLPDLIRRFMLDESGAVLVEFSLFLSLVSIVAIIVTISFANESAANANDLQTRLATYAQDPQSYE